MSYQNSSSIWKNVHNIKFPQFDNKNQFSWLILDQISITLSQIFVLSNENPNIKQLFKKDKHFWGTKMIKNISYFGSCKLTTKSISN